MSGRCRTIVVWRFVLLALVLGFALPSRAQPHQEAPAKLARPEDPPSPPSDGQVAEEWARALLRGDPVRLSELTALPFSVRSLAAGGRCQKQVTSSAALHDIDDCISDLRGPLGETLAFMQYRVGSERSSGLPAKLKALAGAMTGPGNWIRLTAEWRGFHATLFVRVRASGAGKRVAAALAEVSLDAQAVREVKRRQNYTAMKHAIDRGDARTVRRLLGQGAGVDDAGSDEFPGDPPIALAAARGDLAIIDVLLAAGAHPDACCCSCVTALHRAIEGGHLAAVQRLLVAGADPRVRYDRRLPTLELARRGGDPEIVRCLESATSAPPGQPLVPAERTPAR